MHVHVAVIKWGRQAPGTEYLFAAVYTTQVMYSYPKFVNYTYLGITYYRVVLLYFFVLVYYDYRIPLTQERYSTLQKAVRLFPDILGFVNIHLILVRWLEINNIQFAVQVAHVTQVSQY